jgi:hypothetical protein
MIILELCIQYLCMTLPDSQLPQGFDPRKNEKRAVFEVFRKKNTITEKSVVTEMKDENTRNSNDNAFDDKSVRHNTTLSVSHSDSQLSSSLPQPPSSSLSSSSSSSSKLWTKSCPCPVIVIDDEKRILTFLVTYGWEVDDVKYALQIASTLHSTSSSSSSSSTSSFSSTSISSASSTSTSTNAPQKNSVSTVSTSVRDVRDVRTADTPELLGPILGPSDLPPLGLTALCVLWFATRYRTLYHALPLSTLSPTTSSDNQNESNVEEEIKSIDIILDNFLAQFTNDSKGSSGKSSGKKGDEIDEEKGEEETDDIECEIQDEIESLLSIFPDSLKYTKETVKPYFESQNVSQNREEKGEKMLLLVKREKSHLLTLSLDRVEGEHTVCAARTYLDVYIIPFLNYPKNVPMMYVRNNAMNAPKLPASENNGFDVNNGDIEDSMLLFTQIEIMAKARESEGDASIFHMSSFLEEKLGLIVSGYESNEEKKKKISISLLLDRIYKYGFIEKKINLILSSINSNDDNGSSVSNSGKNRGNDNSTIYYVSDDATDKTTKESKEHSAEHSIENLKEKNFPSQVTSQSPPTTLTKQTSIPTSTSTSNKDLESMSEISSSTMSMKIKKHNKPSFWSVSEKKTRAENVPKSALYLRMAEGRKKLPAHNSRS